jgi:hypothetical protein
VAKAELMARAWDSSTGARNADARRSAEAYRPEGLDPRTACTPTAVSLSDEQAQQILQMRLQRLTGLEQDKIVNEYREVMDRRSPTCSTSSPSRRASPRSSATNCSRSRASSATRAAARSCAARRT